MNLTGEYRLAAPREVVWRALNDPEILRQSIPGCETVEKLSDTELTARVTLAIGPMKAKFSGKVTLSDLQPPQPGQPAGYTIAGEGQGGVAGFGKGKANVALDEAASDSGVPGAATVMRYQAEAQVGGKIAQLGARLIDATARKLADEFFGRFAAIINAPPPEAEAVTGPQPGAGAAAGAPAPELPAPELPAEVEAHPAAARPGSSDTASPPFVAPPPEDTTGRAHATRGGAAAGAAGGGLRPALWIPLLIAVVALLLWWFASG